MLRFLKFLLYFLLFSSCSKGQKINNSKVSNENHFEIKTIRTVEAFEQKSNFELSYQLFEEKLIDLDNDNVIDTIRLFRLNDWADPGDFHKVEVETKYSKYELSNIDGWVQHNWKNKSECCLLVDSSIGILKVAKNNSVILLEGYPYASDPPTLSIISINQNKEISMVMHDNKNLYDVSDSNKNSMPEISFGNSRNSILTQELGFN